MCLFYCYKILITHMKRTIFTLILILSNICVSFAQIAKGECAGTGKIEWTLHEDGTLKLDGKGMIDRYDETPAPWTPYKEKIKRVEISEGIMTVGECAFQNCSNLRSVSLPETMHSISQFAFAGTGLDSITIPNYTIGISASAFRDCHNLKKVVLPVTLREIKRETFCGCTSLREIEIPMTVSEIGSNAFKGCSNLTHIEISALTKVGYDAFQGCTKLNGGPTIVPYTEQPADSVRFSGTCGKDGDNVKWTLTYDGTMTLSGKGECADYSFINTSPWGLYKDDIVYLIIEEGIESVGAFMFNSCEYLTSVSLPHSLKHIKEYGFGNCSRLFVIDLPDGVVSLGRSCFTHTKIKSLTLPNSIKRWADSFTGCDKLESVTLPANITYIPSFAFSHCKNLKSIRIPDSVQYIGEKAFWHCSSLETVTVRESLEHIGPKAFEGCTKLNEERLKQY